MLLHGRVNGRDFHEYNAVKVEASPPSLKLRRDEVEPRCGSGDVVDSRVMDVQPRCGWGIEVAQELLRWNRVAVLGRMSIVEVLMLNRVAVRGN